MFNLLPHEEKNSLRKEYRFREYSVIVGALLALVITAICSLFPSYILSITRRQTVGIEKVSLEEQMKKNSGTAAQTVVRANNLTDAFSNIPHPEVTDWVRVIDSARPQGIVIVRFNFSRIDEERQGYEIQGIARSRDALQKYERALQVIPRMEGVKVPIESYTRETNIPFTITATVIK